jgi:NTP pyrophosphatase (non-canonical NTP hydrolase)
METMSNPYCIGSGTWNGLSKLIEECGEVQQVAGKIIGAEGKDRHFDGTNLRVRLESELGDLLAAIQFMIHHNDLDAHRIGMQRSKKLKIFEKWNDE